MNKYLPAFIIVFLLLLILFDAGQQYFYITSFDLAPDGVTVSFFDLLKNHLGRWFVWLLFSIPFFLHVRFRYRSHRNQPVGITSALLLFTSLLLALASISILGLFAQNLTLTAENFKEFFSFFFFQKGMTFLMADVCSALLIANYSREHFLKVQVVEIKKLRKVNDELRLHGTHQEVPHLYIKTGHKLKHIPIDEIAWIQSDDYCVKVHTPTATYTLRQSLKHLEEKLQNFRFIRIHRSALLNLDYLDQINDRASTVRLKNQIEVQASKTGIQKLRQQLVSTTS